MKTPDYLSYERYKREKNSSSNRRISIFITTFVITLLFFIAVVKSLSPDVDVTIGDDESMDAKESGLGVKRFIDERLKMIQMDDTSSNRTLKENKDQAPSEANDTSFDKYAQKSPSNKNNYSYQTQNTDTNDYSDNNGDEDSTTMTAPVAKTAPKPKTKDLNVQPEKPKVSKVFIGRYSTLEQAKVSQEILMDSGLGVTPFIKNAGSYYTLQLGSYSSKAKADGLAAELRQNGFPARVTQE